MQARVVPTSARRTVAATSRDTAVPPPPKRMFAALCTIVPIGAGSFPAAT
jgi:hypothetical protein